MPFDMLAFDKISVRSYDRDGRLHVQVSNISKANICPYFGREIPKGDELGLDPAKIYQLYRSPEELAKAASTFNNIQLLSKHIAVHAEVPRHNLVVGSTGTDAAFQAPYLQNSLVVWDADAIHDIESRRTQELSCAYHYRADMTPGTINGVTYDGVMRDIVGNHVALVADGRAGDDVMVGDAMPFITETVNIFNLKEPQMPVSYKASQARGALSAYLRPKLAKDAKIDLRPIVLGLTDTNFKTSKNVVRDRLKAATQGKLAADATIDDVIELLDRLDDEIEEGGTLDADLPKAEMKPLDAEKPKAKDENGPEAAEEEDDEDEKKKKAKQTAAEAAEAAAVAAKDKAAKDKAAKDKAAKDAEVKESKAAMDAAIETATKAAEERTIARLRGIQAAERFVQPWVGEIKIAQDSAEEVFRVALEGLGIKTAGVHPDAFRHILEAQPKPGDRLKPRIAQDSAATAGVAKSYADRFGADISRLKVG